MDVDEALYIQIASWRQANKITDRAYTELRAVASTQGWELPSLRKRYNRLQSVSGIRPRLLDCCRNSCIAFTGDYEDLSQCLVCQSERYRDATTKKPYQQFIYVPLVDRLRLQYKCRRRAFTLQTYCKPFFDNYNTLEPGSLLNDWWAGARYAEIRAKGMLSTPRDIALQIAADGVSATKISFNLMPVVLFNLNLPPQTRYQLRNVLTSLIVPGPSKVKQHNLDSFLHPLIEELKELGDVGSLDTVDAFRGEKFTLKAWPVLITGDGPAVADLIGMKSPGSAKSPCRHCYKQGTRSIKKRYYIPNTVAEIQGDLLLRSNLREVIDLAVVAPKEWRKDLGK